MIHVPGNWADKHPGEVAKLLEKVLDDKHVAMHNRVGAMYMLLANYMHAFTQLLSATVTTTNRDA